MASHRLVFTRSLGFFGMSDGVTTIQACPRSVKRLVGCLEALSLVSAEQDSRGDVWDWRVCL